MREKCATKLLLLRSKSHAIHRKEYTISTVVNHPYTEHRRKGTIHVEEKSCGHEPNSSYMVNTDANQQFDLPSHRPMAALLSSYLFIFVYASHL